MYVHRLLVWFLYSCALAHPTDASRSFTLLPLSTEMKVAGQSNVKAVAGSIAHNVRHGNFPTLTVMGPASVNQVRVALFRGAPCVRTCVFHVHRVLCMCSRVARAKCLCVSPTESVVHTHPHDPTPPTHFSFPLS